MTTNKQYEKINYLTDFGIDKLVDKVDDNSVDKPDLTYLIRRLIPNITEKTLSELSEETLHTFNRVHTTKYVPRVIIKPGSYESQIRANQEEDSRDLETAKTILGLTDEAITSDTIDAATSATYRLLDFNLKKDNNVYNLFEKTKEKVFQAQNLIQRHIEHDKYLRYIDGKEKWK